MTNKIPTPKAPGDRRLRDHRFHVYISAQVPSKVAPGKMAQRVHTEGRFVTEKAARIWAEVMRKPGEKVNLAYFSKIDGWKPHGIDTLSDEGWRGR